MELKLTKSRNIEGVCNWKLYECGSFVIRVIKDSVNETIEIEAFDKFNEITIKAIDTDPAILSVENIYISSTDKLQDLLSRLVLAKDLLMLINDHRNTITKF